MKSHGPPFKRKVIMITAVLVAVVLLLYVLYVIVDQSKPLHFPPGPSWWPFLGNGLMLRKLALELNGQHLALSKLAKDYKTSLLGLRLGGEYVVVGFSPSVVRDILSRDEFNGRPDSFFMRLRCFGKREGVTGSDGPSWQQQRAFVVKHLKVFGFGKTTMEDIIQEEVADVIAFIRKENKPLRMSQVLAPTIMSVLWGLVAGKRLQRTDERLIRLLDLLNRRSRAFDMAGGYLNQFPWLRHLAPEKTGFNLLKLLNSELKSFLVEIVEEHKRSYSPGETRDLIDAYLHESYTRTNDNASAYIDSNLVVVLLDLFIAGSQTTSSTLDFAFLYMLKNPDIQERVYKCLRDNIGENSVPKMADRSRLSWQKYVYVVGAASGACILLLSYLLTQLLTNLLTKEYKDELPYVEAVIAEVQRLSNVVPVCGPRRCLKDTNLNGYFIPKDCTVLISLWSVHKDESIFHEPDKFSPDRFLDSEGRFTRDVNLLPFGLGKRRCLGDVLAKSCIFLIFCGIISNFRVIKPCEDPEPSLEPLHGITLAPQKYRARFVPR